MSGLPQRVVSAIVAIWQALRDAGRRGGEGSRRLSLETGE